MQHPLLLANNMLSIARARLRHVNKAQLSSIDLKFKSSDLHQLWDQYIHVHPAIKHDISVLCCYHILLLANDMM